MYFIWICLEVEHLYRFSVELHSNQIEVGGNPLGLQQNTSAQSRILIFFEDCVVYLIEKN